MTQPSPWLWADKNWPRFQWDDAALRPLETQFLKGTGRLLGARQHLNAEDQTELRIDWLSDEAMETMDIVNPIHATKKLWNLNLSREAF